MAVSMHVATYGTLRASYSEGIRKVVIRLGDGRLHLDPEDAHALVDGLRDALRESAEHHSRELLAETQEVTL